MNMLVIKTLLFFFINILISGVAYLIASLFQISWNPNKWTEGGMATLLICSLIGVIVSLFVCLNITKKDIRELLEDKY